MSKARVPLKEILGGLLLVLGGSFFLDGGCGKWRGNKSLESLCNKIGKEHRKVYTNNVEYDMIIRIEHDIKKIW